MLKKAIIIIVVILVGGFIFLETYTPSLSENHGKIHTKLYLGDSINQPLVVGFGGGEGGSAWESDYWTETRNEFIKQGYAFLAVGYFGIDGVSQDLDRISLNAIYDSIKKIASHPKIDSQKIALIGGSKGAELILNLASRYSDFGAVVGIVPCHVSFPATTITASTSSWTVDGKEVPYVPMPWAAAPSAMKGDLLGAFSVMLQDSVAVEKARIEVENINGPLLLLSATKDEMWPSTSMSEQIMQRLGEKGFNHYYSHIPIEGGHTEPLKHFDLIFKFLAEHFKKSP